MRTFSTSLKRADTLSGIIKTVDARIMALPDFTSGRKPQAKNLDERLKSAFHPTVSESNVLTAIKEERAYVKSKFVEAKAELELARKSQAVIEGIADYLNGNTDKLPADAPSDVAMCAIQLRSAEKAGLQNVAPGLAREFRNSAKRAEAEIVKMDLIIQRREIASKIGQSKALSEKLRKMAAAPNCSEQFSSICMRSARRYDVIAIKGLAESKLVIKQFNAHVAKENL